jgi:hypothetical protein
LDGSVRYRVGRARPEAWVATVLISIPTLFNVFCVIAFTIGVSPPGF